MPRSLKISIRTVETATIVDLEGDVDITASPSLRARLLETLPGCVRLVVNMSGIRYLDSAGVATMVEARLKAKELEKDFALFGLNEKVLAVLKLTRLVGFFRVAESEEQAVQGDPAAHG